MSTVCLIGPFEFITLDGQPPAPQGSVAVVSKPGIDGILALYTGFRGQQFTLRSKVDAADKAAARQLYQSYRTLIGQGPQLLEWSGIEMFAAETFRVLVLDVKPVDIRTLAAASGGLNSPSLGWVECDWLLIGV